MKVIAKKIWQEPAAFIGLLVTLGLLVLNLVGDDKWSAQTIVEVIAPLVSALGIRQLVSPVAAQEEKPPAEKEPPPTPPVNPATKLPSNP